MYLLKNKPIYTTKIMESVCVYVCMYVCPAMHFAMLWSIELKLGMGVGDGSTRFVGIFSKRPYLGSKVIQGSICLKNVLWLPNLVRRRTPDQSLDLDLDNILANTPRSQTVRLMCAHEILLLVLLLFSCLQVSCYCFLELWY